MDENDLVKIKGINAMRLEVEEKATQAPWYASYPDDEWHMSACVVSTIEDSELAYDGKNVAITLLQQPRYAGDNAYDENTQFIVFCRNNPAGPIIKELVEEVEKSQRLLKECYFLFKYFWASGKLRELKYLIQLLETDSDDNLETTIVEWHKKWAGNCKLEHSSG